MKRQTDLEWFRELIKKSMDDTDAMIAQVQRQNDQLDLLLARSEAMNARMEAALKLDATP
jgi:hypothetical protein